VKEILARFAEKDTSYAVTIPLVVLNGKAAAHGDNLLVLNRFYSLNFFLLSNATDLIGCIAFLFQKKSAG